jgi:hypothetical protein
LDSAKVTEGSALDAKEDEIDQTDKSLMGMGRPKLGNRFKAAKPEIEPGFGCHKVALPGHITGTGLMIEQRHDFSSLARYIRTALDTDVSANVCR